MFETGDEPIVEPTVLAKAGSRHRWKPEEDVALLRQYRLENPMEVPKASRKEMWDRIASVLDDAGIHVTGHAVAQHTEKIIKAYRKENRLDEWRTGDPGRFEEKEQLLCEILEYEDDFMKQTAKKKETKTKLQMKEDRKNMKFQYAAMHSPQERKKQMKRTLDDSDEMTSARWPGDQKLDEQDGPFVKERRSRATWQSGVNDYLNSTREIEKEKASFKAEKSNRKLKLEEDRLVFEREKLLYDQRRKERLALLEQQREERLAQDQAARNNQSAAVTNALLSFMSKK